jgi:hypothetical protein
MAALKHGGNRERTQREIAQLAARFIVEDGHESGPARQKAAAEILGAGVRANGAMPDHTQMETALRAHLRTHLGDAHRVLLQRLRACALEWMQALADFQPHLVGAVLNGSATLHSPLHLHLYTDNAKDVEMALLDRGIDIRVAPGEAGHAHVQEVIGFLDAGDGPRGTAPPVRAPHRARETPAAATAVLITVLDTGALRFSPAAHERRQDPDLHPVERSGRASAPMVRQLLAETSGTAAPEAAHA